MTELKLNRNRLNEFTELGRLIVRKTPPGRNQRLRAAIDAIDRLNPPASKGNFSSFTPPKSVCAENALRRASHELVDAMLEYDEWPSK